MHTQMAAWALEVQECGFSLALLWDLSLYLPPAGFYLLTLFLMVIHSYQVDHSCFTKVYFLDQKPKYPGVGLFLQNIFIFVASLLFKFGRSEDMWG